jgi:hypothetical protein
MYRVFAESNFYNSAAVLWADLGVFGTAPMIIEEDFDDVINCVNPCAGEYYVSNNDKNQVDVFYREFTMTVDAVVRWFGEAKVSNSTKQTWKTGGTALQQEIVLCQAIEPNTPKLGSVPDAFPFRCIYWEKGSGRDEGTLQEKGYHEWPAPCPRWDLVSNDAYGRSPAMDALGDIKQLQQEQKRKAQAIDKMVNPPMIADVQLKNQPASAAARRRHVRDRPEQRRLQTRLRGPPADRGNAARHRGGPEPNPVGFLQRPLHDDFATADRPHRHRDRRAAGRETHHARAGSGAEPERIHGRGD